MQDRIVYIVHVRVPIPVEYLYICAAGAYSYFPSFVNVNRHFVVMVTVVQVLLSWVPVVDT